MSDRNEFNFLGVAVFSWGDWDQGVDVGEILFYEPIFSAQSMEEFNHKEKRTLLFTDDGAIELCYFDPKDVDSDEYGYIYRKMYIDEIPEVWEAIKKRH